MTTLHGYILRELAKTFLLTIVAMGALFTLGGGLYNVLQFEGVTPGDLWFVLPMLMPIVITLTMPIAAIFATTMTYGRLAADNELVACRAAGINVHRLFLGAVLLSIFVALFTAVSINFVIPGFLKNIEYYARANVGDLAYQRLRQRGYIHWDRAGNARYTLTAQRVWVPDDADLIAKGYEAPGGGVSYFWVEKPTFLLVNKNAELDQFAVAEGGLVMFDTRGEKVNVALYITDARNLELGERVVQIERQKIGPIEAPIRFPLKPSMINLRELFAWRDAPWLAPDVQAEIDRYLARVRTLDFYRVAAEVLQTNTPLAFTDRAGDQYLLTADEVVLAGRELILSDVEVRVDNAEQTRPLVYRSRAAALLAGMDPQGTIAARVHLGGAADEPVREFHPRAGTLGTAIERDAVYLDELRVDAAVLDRVPSYAAWEVLDDTVDIPGAEPFAESRAEVREEAASLQRKVLALIHSRIAFAISAIVTVLMGAVLGVTFRGARALAAFGLACVPFATTGVLILMGRQLTNSESTHDIGPYVTWVGLAAVGLANLMIMRLGVRR